MSTKPRIAVTVGDPAGIGPEVLQAALASPLLDRTFPFEVLGACDATPGVPTAEGARSALDALETAARGALEGRFAAVVTGPIHKARMRDIGFPFPGQTEFFATRWHTPNHAMLLTGGQLSVALVTAHVPLRSVADALHPHEIVRVGKLLAAFLQTKLSRCPRIAVAGLNPHAGEAGLLGTEEDALITPAITILQTELQASVSGPCSPDTVFYRAVQGEFDGVLCMYHDQGLIPLKLHAFDQGVNVTLGLPFPRTSPDHGTAFDIAGRSIARPDSMLCALNLAADLLRKNYGARPCL